MGSCLSSNTGLETDANIANNYDYTNNLQSMRSQMSHLYDLSVDPSNKNDLKLQRDKFWLSQQSGDSNMWDAIKACIDAENNELSESILQSANLKPFEADLDNKMIFTEDSSGSRYLVPLFVFYCPDSLPMVAVKKAKAKAGGKAQLQTLSIRFSNNIKDSIVKIMSNVFIGDLIKKLSESNDLDPARIHIFQMGRPFKGNELLGELNNKAKVQVFVDTNCQA